MMSWGWLDSPVIGRAAYLLLILVAAISLPMGYFRLQDQTHKLKKTNQQLQRTNRLLVATSCSTDEIVAALVEQAANFISQGQGGYPPGARERITNIFRGYVETLESRPLCR